MITETQTRVIVLQLTDELLTQLQPCMVGLDITATAHSDWAYQEIYEHDQFAGYAKVKQCKQRLTMHGDVYDPLTHTLTYRALQQYATSTTGTLCTQDAFVLKITADA